MGFVECPMCRRAVPDDREEVTRHTKRDHTMWQVGKMLWRFDPVFLIKEAAIIALAVSGALLALVVLWR